MSMYGGYSGGQEEHFRPRGTWLAEFGEDLTEKARRALSPQWARQGYQIDPLIGREVEIQRIIQILARKKKNNPMLIGEPGVGKTAVVEGLASRIAVGDVPEFLRKSRVIELKMASIVAGCKYRGEFEERLKNVLKELKEDRSNIAFFDELHTLIGAGAPPGELDASNIIKPALSRGELCCIGATTIDEYRKRVERDAALARRFQPVMIPEPSFTEAVEILLGLRKTYALHHRLEISDAAVYAAVNLASRYITDRFLPDKAIDVLDEACSKLRMETDRPPQEVKDLISRMRTVRSDLANATRAGDQGRARDLRDDIERLQCQIELVRMNHKDSVTIPVLTAEHIAQVVTAWTGIPLQRLTESESARLLRLDQVMHERVIGQNQAVTAVAKAIRRSRAGLKSPKRPAGSFIFCGPTGVGKTELAKTLAFVLFGDENAMVRLDMSEFMEKHTASKLIGAAPGYIGYENGGQLTEAIRRKPYSVILFDEVEKAHPDVFNLLLAMLDDGRLTDNRGRTVDCSNTIIIMTTNLGSSLIADGGKQSQFGFQIPETNHAAARHTAISNLVTEQLKRNFRPEFLNRVDEVIVFQQLAESDIRKIVDINLSHLEARLVAQSIGIVLTDDAKDQLARGGYDRTYGARPLNRYIQRNVEDPLSEALLTKQVQPGDVVIGFCDSRRIILMTHRQLEAGDVAGERTAELRALTQDALNKQFSHLRRPATAAAE